MSQRRVTLAWFSLKVALLLLGPGCGSATPASRELAPVYVPAEIQPDLGESIVSKSTQDAGNRYVAMLRVDGGQGMCSGVLVAPRVVLTAGHCVCAPREAKAGERPAWTVIDRTTCAQTANVKVLNYPSGEEPGDQVIVGRVRPHEQLRILYNDEGREVSSNADLATILLGRSPRSLKPIRIAKERVRYRQPVTLVGYGFDKLKGGTQGVRRFGFNEIATISEDGATFLVGKPVEVRRPYKPKERLLVREEASYGLEGDSGGPCLIERNGAMELVGIAKTYYGGQELVQFSEYTSMHFYLEWLRREIANAERREAN